MTNFLGKLVKKTILYRICYRFQCLRKEIKKQRQQKAFLSTQVSDLRYAKRILTDEVQALKLELELKNE